MRPARGYDRTLMIRTLDMRGLNITPETVGNFVPRVSTGSLETQTVVASLMDAVRLQGSQALKDQSAEFDGVTDLVIAVTKK